MGILDFIYDTYAGIRYSPEGDEMPEDKMECEACHEKRIRKDCSSGGLLDNKSWHCKENDQWVTDDKGKRTHIQGHHSWKCLETKDFQCKKCSHRVTGIYTNQLKYGGCPEGNPHLWKRIK
jgi:DNA-directed RNA polymerase subunit RPC12/RpoP